MDSSAETDPRVRVRQQEVVAELGQRALEIDDLDRLMEEAADAVAETLDTGQCSVLELLPAGDSARLRQAAGASEDHVGTATVPVGPDTLAGRVLGSADPVVVVADVDDEDRFAVPDLLTDAGAASAVAAVVGSTDDPWGVVCAHAAERRPFTEADASFVRNVANVLASAVENERARSELEEVYGRVSDAVFALDEAWNFTYLNERAHELINPDDRELVGETVWEAFPEAVGRSFREQYERAMYEQEAVSFEEYYPEPLDAWFDVQAYPSETGLSVYFRDVTERKERERELAERERRLSTLIDNVPGVVYRCRNERGWPMTFVSDACADVSGYEAEALESGAVSWGEDVVLESDRKPLWDAVQEGVRETGTFSETYRVETADGEVRWVRDVGRGVVEDGEDGEVVGIEGIITDVTERMRTEHELEEKERRYEAVFEDPNILVGLLEPDGTVLDINQTAMEYVDADLEDVTGEPFWETPWWGEGDEVQDDVREWTERAADGEYVDFETDLTRPDGKGYTLSGYFRPVTDDDGEVVSIIVSDRDVTERKERERELEESEQRYRTLAEHFPNGVVALVDGDLRYRTVGGDPMPTANATVEDVEGRLVAEVLPAPVAEALVPRYEAALEDESSEFELEFDGSVFQFDVVPVRDDDGEVFAALGTSRDVTERTERERELARYETIVETVNDGIYVKDPEGRFTMVNDAYAELTGYDREELVGEHASMVVDEAAIRESRELVDRSAGEDDGNPAVETMLQTAGDETVPAEGTFSTLRTPDGDELEVGVVRDVTERREAQRELRESEAKFRMLAENLEEVVWMADADAEEFVYINPAFEDVWDLDREVLYDDMLAFIDAIHPEDRERVRENFTALPAEEFDDEFRILRDDGEVRWVRARGARVRDEDAEMVRVVGIGEDVTERKRRERQLEESERRYRTLAENFPNGAVGVYDPDLRYTLAAGEMVGDPLPDAGVVEGTKMTELYPDDVVEDLESMFRAAVEDGEAGSARTTVFGRHWEAWATPLRNADGEIFAGLSFNQDVTEQVEREAELERALALLERAERIADVGGWEIDPETTEVFWTDQVFDLLEVPGDEEPPLEEALAMYHEEDQSIVEDAVEEALETGDPFDVEVRLRTAASGEERWLRLQGVPEIEAGEVVSLRGAAQDVTERKERERRLEESNERLEQFAYAASHDLQEPLRMVSSYLQLVDQRYAEALDDDGREFIDYAVDGADRMREMIEALLEYSRVETEGNPLEPIELDAVVEDVLADLQLQIEETDAAIAVDSLPRVEGDASQLRQLFQNLLENALTYAGDEPPRIDVSAERVGARWRLSVSDEGVGVDPGEQDAIFQVFQRLHSREEHPGTGIGLALCRRIVERHGGEIWVDSEPGEGSTFTFTLPAAGDGDE